MIKLISGFFILTILIPTVSFAMSKKFRNESVLSQSGINIKSYRKVFKDIKRTLPDDLNSCPIEIVSIKLIKKINDSVLEDWTVKICDRKEVYLISTYHPKGYFCTATLKEKIFNKQKETWNAVKDTAQAEEWRDALFYVDEIEAMRK